MLVGYARVSTQDQDTALQLDALASLGCQRVFQEKASGASRKNRPELARCLASLRAGDVLCIYKIDRVARSLFDLLAILRQLENVGASIKSVTEPLDTSNPMGVFVIQILGSVAQLERSMIVERSIAGQNAARLRGRFPGRARALPAEVEAELVAVRQSEGLTYAALACRYGVSTSVVKRAVYRVTKTPQQIKRGRV